MIDNVEPPCHTALEREHQAHNVKESVEAFPLAYHINHPLCTLTGAGRVPAAGT